jgi:hypothetical protein
MDLAQCQCVLYLGGTQFAPSLGNWFSMPTLCWFSLVPPADFWGSTLKKFC